MTKCAPYHPEDRVSLKNEFSGLEKRKYWGFLEMPVMLVRGEIQMHVSKNGEARVILALLSCWLLVGSCLAENVFCAEVKRAAWMEGGWGVRVVLPAGEQKNLYDFDVERFVSQVSTLKTLSWVMLNLTADNDGAYFTAPQPQLEEIHPSIVPSRDLLGELLSEFERRGVKVILYFESHGPSSEHLNAYCKGSKSNSAGCQRRLRVQRNWQDFLATKSLSDQQGVAEYCIAPFSKRYGTKISGWWFDAGVVADTDLLTKAARSGNQNAAVTFNIPGRRSAVIVGHGPKGNSVYSRSLSVASSHEDYTSGHPTPYSRQLPSLAGNEQLVKEVSGWDQGGRVVPHVFFPMQEHWTWGVPVIPLSKAVLWTRKVTDAGGAITWAAALSTTDVMSEINSFQMRQLQDVDLEMANYYKNMKTE